MGAWFGPRLGRFKQERAFVKSCRTARAALQATICDLDPLALDDKKATELKIKFAELRGWLDEEKRDGLYWADLSVAISSLSFNAQSW